MPAAQLGAEPGNGQPQAETRDRKRVEHAIHSGGVLAEVAQERALVREHELQRPRALHRAGAAGILASEVLAHSPADGYALVMVSIGHAFLAGYHTKLPYDTLKDFAAVGLIGNGAYVLVVNNSVPAKSVSEFVALAKSRPGEIVFASAGIGNLKVIAFSGLKDETHWVHMEIFEGSYGGRQGKDGMDAVDTLYANTRRLHAPTSWSPDPEPRDPPPDVHRRTTGPGWRAARSTL